MSSVTTPGDSSHEDEQHFAQAMHLVYPTVLTFVMQTSLELGLFEILAKTGPDGQLSAQDIAAQLPTKNPEATAMLERMLRLLATHSVINCTVEASTEDGGASRRMYKLGPVGKYFVKNEDGVSLGPLFSLIQDNVFLRSWGKLQEAILEGGIPFNRAYGTHAFEYPSSDARFNQVFNSAMFNHTTIVMKQLVEHYKGFENINQLVDVGGGLGQTLQIILKKYPHIKGTNFDLPHVLKNASPYPGVEHVGGDMFESVPSADAIFMKWILHDWSDAHCLKLLKNCYKALPDDGKVIVYESVVSEEPETTAHAKFVSELDMVMLTVNPGGKERTKNEFLDLAKAAGFSGIKFEYYVRCAWVMEFYK